MEKIVSKVEKQEVEITYIKKSLDELIDQNKSQSFQLEKISDSIKNQELILEKISNLDDKYGESVKRCHHRMDDEISKYEHFIDKIENDIGKLKYEISNKPCGNYNVLDTKIAQMQKELNKYAKLIWWVGTTILGVVIVAILKDHLY